VVVLGILRGFSLLSGLGLLLFEDDGIIVHERLALILIDQ